MDKTHWLFNKEAYRFNNWSGSKMKRMDHYIEYSFTEDDQYGEYKMPFMELRWVYWRG